jgi:hypothetical protein
MDQKPKKLLDRVHLRAGLLLGLVGLAFSISCGVLSQERDSPSVPTKSPIQTDEPARADDNQSAGQVYYVAVDDPGASDDNNGLFASYQGGRDGPWRNMKHAAEVMETGDTVYVRKGTYREAGITFTHSGASGKPITLSAYPGETVILDGSGEKEEMPGIMFAEGQSHYLIQGLTIRNMPWSGIATDDGTEKPYRDITIRECVLYDNGWSGIDLAAVDGFLVEDVESYGNAFYGLNISGSEDGILSATNGRVTGSRFHHHTGLEGHGLAINQGYNIWVEGNIAFHNTIHGFDVSDWPKFGALSHDITLDGNLSYENGGAGFAINSDSHHVIFQRNIAWENGAGWADRGTSSGFLCYEGCWQVTWLNNVAVRNSDAGFFIEPVLGVYGDPGEPRLIFHNNIAYQNGLPGSDERPALVVQGEMWVLDITHNNWGGSLDPKALVVGIFPVGDWGKVYSSEQINRGHFQIDNLSVDPGFQDLDGGDYRLLPDSTMIDAGVDVGLPFCGDAPDLGAVEWCP